MIDSYWKLPIIVGLCMLIIGVLVYLFLFKKYTFKEIKDFFARDIKKVLIAVGAIVAVFAIIGISSASKKNAAIKEIQLELETAVQEAYKGEYAIENGLKNIEVTVDDIDNYLGAYHVYATIKCEADSLQNEWSKEFVCDDIMDSLPNSVETSQYGSVAIDNIIYKPDNETYGVSIYVNEEQIFIHGMSFDDYEDEVILQRKIEKEKEFESKYNEYSEYYGAKEALKNW